ncbi:nucleoside 2-deoxyribosyltransferase [Pseudoroseomonas wenyumeiae]
MTPFRGPSADAGTVFELGFMRALGRPVFGYANAVANFRDRTLAFLGGAARPGRSRASGRMPRACTWRISACRTT